MEALINCRIKELLTFRRWYRANRWAAWSDLRREHETELRALVRLARQYRREFRAIDYPATATYHDWQAS